MVKILAGEKGEGKSKKMIEMVNEEVKTAKGHIVFIDDDDKISKHVNHDVRFIQTSDFEIVDKNVFVGFVLGILSRDSDIEKVYIDGLSDIIKKLPTPELEKFVLDIEKISTKHNIDFYMIISGAVDSLPVKVKPFVM